MTEPKKIYEKQGFQLLEYNPSLFHPLYMDFEPMRFVRRMRFMTEYFRKGKYKVYYLKVDDKLVGHCVVTPGGRRLKCSTKNDVVLGPYFIQENERGKGYSKKLISLVLKHCSYDYLNAYDWVDKKNIASRRASESCGFLPVAELDVKMPFRTLVIVDQGEDIVYQYKRKQ